MKGINVLDSVEDEHIREEIIAVLEERIHDTKDEIEKKSLEMKLERELSGKKFPSQSIVYPSEYGFNFFVNKSPDTWEQNLIFEEFPIANIFEVIRSSGRGMKPSDIQKSMWVQYHNPDSATMVTIEETIELLTGKTKSKLIVKDQHHQQHLYVLHELAKISGWYKLQAAEIYKEACDLITADAVKKEKGKSADEWRLKDYLDNRRLRFTSKAIKRLERDKKYPSLLTRKQIVEPIRSPKLDFSAGETMESTDFAFPRITDRAFWNPQWKYVGPGESDYKLIGSRLKSAKDSIIESKDGSPPIQPIDSENAYDFLILSLENYCPMRMIRKGYQELLNEIRVNEGYILTRLTPGDFHKSYKPDNRLMDIEDKAAIEMVIEHGETQIGKMETRAEEYKRTVKALGERK